MGITVQELKRMQERLNGTARSAKPVLEPSGRSSGAKHQTILGLDPSLRGTGYGVIRLAKPHPQAMVYGTVFCPPTLDRSRCLVRIIQCLRDILRQHQPTVCVVEGLFYAQNLQTAIILGEARGAALSVIAEAGLEIFELAPRKAKQAIVGYGGAGKPAVAGMVQRMLRLPEPPAPDAADALALALTHAREHGRFSLQPAKRI